MFPIMGAGNPTGYNLTRSVRLRASASAYLSRTPASATNRRTWTLSCWIKRGALSFQGIFTGKLTKDDTSSFYYASDKLSFFDRPANVTNINLSTDAVYRDPSAWYHVVLVADTTNATSTDRIRIYVNNTRQTLSGTYPSQNYEITYINNTTQQAIGVFQDSTGYYFDGYLAEVNFIDGQALTPSSFGETDLITGVWKPKRYAGTYGTNGFYLPFTDNSALTTSSNAGLGKDFSGNGNYWTTNNISITSGVTYDSMTDVPTLTSATAANFAVLNPLDTGSNITLSAANLQTSQGASAGISKGTIGVSSGKWYWEVTLLSGTTSVGIANVTSSPTQNYVGQSSTSYGYYSGNGNKYNNASGSSYGASYTTNDVIGVALDLDAGTLVFYKNNSSQGTAFSSLSGTFVPAIGNDQSNTTAFNAGQRPFAYTQPSGFKALNTFNLPNSTIVKGNTVMDATLYTGTGSALSITNAAPFQPDFVWIKRRDGVANHALFDSVRGVRKVLISNATDVEVTETAGTSLTAFNSNGFSLGTNGGAASVNINGSTFVGWQWQAGQGTTSSNTNGTITSTVSVNASAGFSVVTYTGISAAGTVGHGLGVAPSFIVVKDRSRAGFNWSCYHSSLGATYAILLNSTNAAASGSTDWNSTAPTSSVFSIPTGGGSYNTNYNGDSFVAYCWTPIAGYSAFGSYTGNGSSDGTFVYTGFRPKFLLIKSTAASGNWWMYDTSRSTFNLASVFLYANASDAEVSDTANGLDMLSNGFKLRVVGNYQPNTNGGTFIYAAFAENPFKNSLAR